MLHPTLFALTCVPMTLALCSGFATACASETSPLRAALPANVPFSVQLHDSARLVRQLLDTPQAQTIRRSQAWKTWQSSADGQKLLQGLVAIKGFTGNSPVDLLQRLFGQQTVIGFRKENGVDKAILLARFKDATTLQQGMKKLQDEVISRIGSWPFNLLGRQGETNIYGGLTLQYATTTDTLILSSSASLLKECLNNVQSSKNTDKNSVSAPLSIHWKPTAQDTEHIPLKMDNLVASLIGGHWAATFKQAKAVNLDVHQQENGLHLQLRMEQADGQVPESHLAFIPAVSPDPLTQILAADKDLAAMHFARNWQQWWQANERFLNEEGRHGLGQLEQGLNLVFPGQSLRDDILPSIQPLLHGVVKNRDYAKSPATPALPAFAFIATTTDPEHLAKRLRGGLQAIAGLITVDRAQKGMDDQFFVERERIGDQVVYTLFKEGVEQTPTVEANFSFSLSMVGNRLIISSTRELAASLVKMIVKHKVTGLPTGEASAASPDYWHVDAQKLDHLLAANRKTVLAKHMLEDGLDHKAATQRLTAMHEILALFKDVSLTSAMKQRAYQVDLMINLAAPEPAP